MVCATPCILKATPTFAVIVFDILRGTKNGPTLRAPLVSNNSFISTTDAVEPPPEPPAIP